MVIAYVPAGEFSMGHVGSDSDTEPVHSVDLDAYWIDTTEVTHAMYAKFLNEMGNQVEANRDWYFPLHMTDNLENGWQVFIGYENQPVVNVNWYGARAYCEWANRRLPTEAEWEKAARGGLQGRSYSWGDEEPVCELDAVNGASFHECSQNQSFALPVASYLPNSYGLFDMVGNASEWVADWYAEDYYINSEGQNPTGPSDGTLKVMRGGGYYSRGPHQVYKRISDSPENYGKITGFRCAVSKNSVDYSRYEKVASGDSAALKKDEWFDKIRVGFVSYEEKLSEPGSKLIEYQLLVQNISEDMWIPLNYIQEVISTAEGYRYERDYKHGYISSGGVVLAYRMRWNTGLYPFPLPPGFQTLLPLSVWQISEFASNPEVELSLGVDDFTHVFSIEFKPENQLANIETPFVDNISFSDYQKKYGSNANVLSLEQTATYSFGEITWKGFQFGGKYDSFVDLSIRNTSTGYPLYVSSIMSGSFIDGGMGYSLNLDYPVKDQDINPSQEHLLRWQVILNIHNTQNFKLTYPYQDNTSMQSPVCIVVPSIYWQREDIGRRLSEVNLIACQE